MNLPALRALAASPCCRAWMAVLVLLLLVQLVAPHTMGVAVGEEICSGDSTRRINGDDYPAGAMEPHHDCCCSLALAPPPNLAPAQVPADRVRFALVTAARLAAQWLAPLSRGPPALS